MKNIMVYLISLFLGSAVYASSQVPTNILNTPILKTEVICEGKIVSGLDSKTVLLTVVRSFPSNNLYQIVALDGKVAPYYSYTVEKDDKNFVKVDDSSAYLMIKEEGPWHNILTGTLALNNGVRVKDLNCQF